MTDATPPPPQPRLGRHQARTRWVVAGIGVAVLIGAAILGTATARRQPARPAASPATAPPPSSLAPDQRGVPPLRGVPLSTATGLRLLVANDPTPFLFDVDRGTTRPVTGLPAGGDRVVWVLPVGADAIVVSDRICNGCRDAGVYRVRHGTTVATRLGTASDVVAAGDGRAVWMLSDQGPTHCTLREVGLDGRPRRPARPIPCTTELVAETSAGLLVTTGSSADGSDWHSTLVDPAGGHHPPPLPPGPGSRRPRPPGAGRRRPAPPAHPRRPAQRRQLPACLAEPAGLRPRRGQGAPRRPARRRRVRGSRPATGGQSLDEWLLDTATRRWRHLPDMPADVTLKFTSMTWTSDGRLVFLAQTADLGDVVAVWRPGQPRIAVRRVKLPKRSGGSDSFVVW